MTESEIYSWIFLATALASNAASTDFRGISMVADGINHAVPSHKELQTSISWLLNRGLIEKDGKKYRLTHKGKSDYEQASLKTNILLEIWENLESQIKNYA